VNREGDEPNPYVRVEALDGLHEANVAFLNQVAELQAVARIAARDVHDEAQMGEHELARRVEIVRVAELDREVVLLLGGEHRHRIRGMNVLVEAAGPGREQKLGLTGRQSSRSHYLTSLERAILALGSLEC